MRRAVFLWRRRGIDTQARDAGVATTGAVFAPGATVFAFGRYPTVYSVGVATINKKNKTALIHVPTNHDVAILRSQFATSSSDARRLAWGGRRYTPHAFTDGTLQGRNLRP